MIQKIEWTKDLATGIEVIDEQHKQWIKHYNHAAAAIEARQEVAQISRSLMFLSDYTETHFATEEKEMAARGYPELEEHKAIHNTLRKTLAAMTREFIEDGATDLLAESVETFLGNWLIKHIKDVDLRFAAFAKTL